MPARAWTVVNFQMTTAMNFKRRAMKPKNPKVSHAVIVRANTMGTGASPCRLEFVRSAGKNHAR